MEESPERAVELRRRKKKESQRKWYQSLTEEQRVAMQRKNYYLRKQRTTEEQRQKNLAMRREYYHLHKSKEPNNVAIAAANKVALASVQGSTSLRAIASPPHHGSNLKSLPLHVVPSVNAADPKEIVVQKEKDKNSTTKEIKLFGKSIFVSL